MSRYRRVETKVWADAAFKQFSAPQPNAQTLWLYLLCGPRTTIFPGLVVGREEVMASDLGWKTESFRKAFVEASAKDRVKVDWSAGLVVLTKALFDSDGDPRESSKPGNPNILKHWAKEWEQIPECTLKDEYLESLKSFAKALGEAFDKAFDKALGKAYAKASRNQYQDQEQKQDQDLEDSDPPTAVGSWFGSDIGSKPKRKRAKKPTDWTPDEIASAKVVLERLTAQNDVQYTGADAHLKLIIRQLRGGISEMDMRAVIGYCAHELGWKTKPEMLKYLRPETLFGPESIAKYLDAARSWFAKLPGQKGES